MTFLKTAIPVMFLMCTTSASYGQVQDSDTTEVVNLEGTVFTAEKKPVIYRLGKKTVSGSSSLSASGGSAVGEEAEKFERSVLREFRGIKIGAFERELFRQGPFRQKDFAVPVSIGISS